MYVSHQRIGITPNRDLTCDKSTHPNGSEDNHIITNGNAADETGYLLTEFRQAV
jgi:hypothetical protein